MWRKLLSLLLALTLSASLSFALPSPSSEPSSEAPRALSPEEALAVSSAIQQMQKALDKSNREIETQLKRETLLWISCGVLVTVDLALVTIELIQVIKKP